MTIAAITPSQSYIENGVTTTRAVNFPFVDEADLVVERTSLAGVTTTLELDVDYTVSGGAFSTGALEMTSGGEDGSLLDLTRRTPRVQSGAYGNDWPEDELERSLDRGMMIAQEQDLEHLSAEEARAMLVDALISDGTIAITHDDAGNTIEIVVDIEAETQRIVDLLTEIIPADLSVAITVLAPGDYGGITVSSGGLVMNIKNKTITAAKFIDTAGLTIFGNPTGIATAPQFMSVPTARTLLGLATAGLLDAATAAEYRAGTEDKLPTVEALWDAAEPVALVDGVTITPDLSTGFNFTLAIGGNRTLANPTNPKPQSGFIEITQDGTGSRTLAYGANWKFDGGTDPVLSTAAGAIDVLYYTVLSATRIHATLRKAIA